MARRRSNFRTNMVRSGRKTFWIGGAHSATTIAAGSSATLITSMNAAALALRPFTIVRTRGVLALISDQIAAVEQQAVNYGQIVVSDQAVAIGITAVPTPVVDDQSSWLVMETLFGRFNFVTGVGMQQLSGSSLQVPFDSKAMRKVEEGQDLIVVVETSAISTGVTLFSYSRTLIKLH